MTKFTTLFILLSVVNCHLFAQKRVSAHLSIQYNSTIHDRTKGNNPWGLGVGLQSFYITKSKFRPALEVTADGYFVNDDVYRVYPDGTEKISISSMINIFAGVSYHPVKQVYLSCTAGPSFVAGQVLPAIKPSIGFYFSA